MDKKQVIEMLRCIAEVMHENKEKLIEMDSLVGDGDLGLTMSDGFLAAYDAANESKESDLGKVLYFAGKAMANKVPSTMGTLMASGWIQSGKALKGKMEFSNSDVVLLFESFAQGVMNRGKAKQGEKTFLDGLLPAVEAMKGQSSLIQLAQSGLQGAMKGFESTATMIAVHGRAATRGEKSRALLDPGAMVAVLMMEGFLRSIKD